MLPWRIRKGGDVKKTATMGDGSVDETFLRIWLSDPELLRREFDAVLAA